MPSIKWADNTPEGKKREELIQKLLPKEPLTITYLEPELNASMRNVLIRTLQKEIEIYKEFPRKGKYNPETLDTRNPKTCFMGQGFQANGFGLEGWYDYDLNRYRKAIGTIKHMEWGDVTLLEIWGGDHMKDHSDMVKGVMRYCYGERKTCPALDFFINPFYKNSATGIMMHDEADKERDKDAEHLLKLASYIEIRDRLKKVKAHNPLALARDEEDDLTSVRNSRYQYDRDEDEDDEEEADY